jgi:glycosyltransferase involved in cell wall biosynthesis
MVAPPWFELPPPGYGGLEVIVAALVDGLVERGHEVTLFGAGRRTGTRARFVSTNPEPQHARLGEVMPAVLHTARVNRLLAAGDFDIVHDHTTDGPMTAAVRRTPTVVTAHGPADGEFGDFFEAVGDGVRLVAISEAQRLERPGLAWAATVHNALPPDAIDPAPRHHPDGPVLWLARFTADKGPDLAIEACRSADIPLVLAGKCNEMAERRYFKKTVEPMLHDGVEVVLNGDRARTHRLLRDARCLVMPIRWNEPFGMVMIEAMAAGTPVVALRRGAVPEIVRHGVTGWLADDPAELPDLLRRVDELDPAECVKHVREKFSAALMARRYERVYLDALARPLLRRRIADARPVPAPTAIRRPDRPLPRVR